MPLLLLLALPLQWVTLFLLKLRMQMPLLLARQLTALPLRLLLWLLRVMERALLPPPWLLLPRLLQCLNPPHLPDHKGARGGWRRRGILVQRANGKICLILWTGGMYSFSVRAVGLYCFVVRTNWLYCPVVRTGCSTGGDGGRRHRGERQRVGGRGGEGERGLSEEREQQAWVGVGTETRGDKGGARRGSGGGGGEDLDGDRLVGSDTNRRGGESGWMGWDL